MRMWCLISVWLILVPALVSCEKELYIIDWVEITTDKLDYSDGETIDKYTKTDGDTIHVHIKNNGDVPINIHACHGRFVVNIEMEAKVGTGVLKKIVWRDITNYNAICDDSGIPFVTFRPGEEKDQGIVLRGDYPPARYRLRFFGDTDSEIDFLGSTHFLYSNEFSIR